MPIVDFCDPVAQRKVSEIVEHRAERQADGGEKQLKGLLGRLRNCTDEIPERQKNDILRYLAASCGSYEGEEPTTYAHLARYSGCCRKVSEG